MNFYEIQSFTGIQQQADGSRLPVESARDARNCCTWDGNLSVGKGYVHHIASAIPGSDRIIKLIPLQGVTEKFYAVTATKLYAFKNSAWATLYTFSSALTSKDIGYVQTSINSARCLLIATGCTRILKVNISDDSVLEFGDGLYSFEGTVSAYDSSTRAITLSGSLDSEAVRRTRINGITIGGKWYKPEELTSYESSTVVLAAAPTTDPAAGDTVTVRGGGSDAHCNFLGMYYGRLIAACDPNAPSRLYWSAVAGDGRTVEDWLSVDASIDASGGYVEIGNEANDPIIGLYVLPQYVLIFKRMSVWRLYGDRPSAYVTECIERSAEEASSAGIVVKYGTPYFLTKTGLKAIGDGGVMDASGGVRYLKEFTPLIYSVSTSKGAHADNRIYFSCKLDSDSVYDDTLLEFDLSTGGIMVRNGFQAADVLSYDGRLFIVDGNRYVCRFNEGTDYAGSPIDAYWKTQPTDLGIKSVSKKITCVHMRCSDGSDFIIFVKADDMSRRTFKKAFDMNSGYIKASFDADWGRVFSIEFSNKNGSQFSINGGVDVEYEKEKR